MSDTAEEYLFEFDFPGLKLADIRISCDDAALYLGGERKTLRFAVPQTPCDITNIPAPKVPTPDGDFRVGLILNGLPTCTAQAVERNLFFGHSKFRTSFHQSLLSHYTCSPASCALRRELAQPLRNSVLYAN